MKKVAVVILNYKVADLAIKCIDSVQKSTYKNYEVIVVDNASGDSIEGRIQKFPQVIFIQNKENLGYTGGNNIGIKKALEVGADYVFILNPDTVVEENAISELVESVEEYNAGISNPKIYFDGSKKIWFAGKRLDTANVLGIHRGVNEQDHGQYDQEEEMEDATGAAMFVRKEVFDKIGLFDERYFLYYEESDFVYRAREAGFKVMYTPKAVIYHKNAQSTGLGSALQDYYITRNRMLFASKFLPFRTRFALFREGLRNLGDQTKRQALIDFLMGKFGKGDI